MNKKTQWIAGSALGAVLLLTGAGVAVAVTDPFDNDGPLTGATLASASEAALAEIGSGTVADAEYNDDRGSEYSVEVRLDNGVSVDVELDEDFDVVFVSAEEWNDFVAAAVPAAVPGDVSGDVSGDDASAAPITAEQAGANRASAETAALAHVGSGTVTDYEVSDDLDHVYEVEVTLGTGVDIDVELDANFVVLRTDGAIQ